MRTPSGATYWTVLDEDLTLVPVADSFLRHVRFGCDSAESTTKSYANSIALFLRWCTRTGRSWQAGMEQLALFTTWFTYAGSSASGAQSTTWVVLAGLGSVRARGVLVRCRSAMHPAPRDAEHTYSRDGAAGCLVSRQLWSRRRSCRRAPASC